MDTTFQYGLMHKHEKSHSIEMSMMFEEFNMLKAIPN